MQLEDVPFFDTNKRRMPCERPESVDKLGVSRRLCLAVLHEPDSALLAPKPVTVRSAHGKPNAK